MEGVPPRSPDALGVCLLLAADCLFILSLDSVFMTVLHPVSSM